MRYKQVENLQLPWHPVVCKD